MNAARWSYRDYEAKLCSFADVDSPKPVGAPTAIEGEVQTVQEVLESLPPATLSEFKQAVLRVARDQHGSYDAFLRAYPHFHQKFLLAMAREAVPPPQGPKVIDVEWLSPQRHAYKYADPSHPLHYIYLKNRKHQITDATIIEPRQ